MASEIERITRQLEKAFGKQPWYGTSVMGILKQVDPSIVHRKLGPHSIVILLQHMVAWRKYVIAKLGGDDSFEVTDEMNFYEPPATNKSWSDALASLEKSQRDLVGAMAKFPNERLDELVPKASYKYTWYTLLHGIIQHDVYHLGQIALLRKALQ
jgi:uncharacterized damage-inducible protein DinB